MKNNENQLKKLRQSIKTKKCLIVQFSCSDLNDPPIFITSIYFNNFFRDTDKYFSADEINFRFLIRQYLDMHKNYYLIFWNHNTKYGMDKLDLGYSNKELFQLEKRIIDFDDALESYCEEKKINYIKENVYERRYYLALLNNFVMNNDWIIGSCEKDIRDYRKLKDSSRIKGKCMAYLLKCFIENTLKIEINKDLVNKVKNFTENQQCEYNIDKKKVFIVHGRDEDSLEEIKNFIKELGLTPIILKEQINKGLTIIEKFEEYSTVNYAIILITPDDRGRLKYKTDLKDRPRQNVLFELGYLISKLKRKNIFILVKKPNNTELPSDIFGIVYNEYDSNNEWQKKLIKELIALKFELNMDIIKKIF